MLNVTNFQDLVGIWAGGTVNGSGGAGTWFDPATGRVTIGRKGRYTVSYSFFVRIVVSGGAALLGNVYGGIGVFRSTTTYNGTTYREDRALFRGNQAQVLANSLQWDLVLSGSFTYVLNAGDQLVVRTSWNATSPGTTVSSFLVRDDGASHITVSQLPDSIVADPD
jgi:hypothetical protein